MLQNGKTKTIGRKFYKMNKNLHEICATLDQWCETNGVVYDIVCDEDDLQGVMLFKSKKINNLLEYLQPLMSGIHLEKQKVRGGTILAFSVAAISESVMENIIKNSGNKKMESSFKERIADAFNSTVVVSTEEVVDEVDLKQALLDSAKEIAAEDQYKTPTIARKAASATSRLKKSAVNPLLRKELQGSEAPTKDEEDNVTESRQLNFDQVLDETLSGMATPDGQQSGDLFGKFHKALDVLSAEMGIKLQDALSQQGIKAKVSDDKSKIILFTISQDTGAPVPLHQIDAEMLADKTQFENKLRDIVDLAKGQAPGTDKQQQDIMRNQDQAIRDIAVAVSPEDQEQNNIEAQMNMQPVGSIDEPTEEPVEEPIENA
jgi:hypothetical protein